MLSDFLYDMNPGDPDNGVLRVNPFVEKISFEDEKR